MAYEVEAISSSTSALPSQPSVMREAVEYDPYRGRSLKAPAPLPGQTDTKERVSPEDPAATEGTVRLAPQVAALARKEQRFRAEQQALARDKAAIASERAELAELKALREKLDAGDYSALDGKVDYNKYSQYQIDKLNGSDPTSEALKKLQSEIEEIKTSSKDNVTKQFEAAVSERRIATAKLVDTTADFPRIKKAKAQEAVVQHILDTWEHDSKELSVEDAAKEVEELLTERANKWKALLEDDEVAPEGEKKQLPPLKAGLKTLTQQVTAGDVKRTLKPLHLMSEGDRYAEARRRAEEKLKQQTR